MTLLDVAMAHAARSLDDEVMASGPGLVTIEMKTTFMRPGVGQVRAAAASCTAPLDRLLRGEHFDARGRATAHATGTFKYVGATDAQPARRPALRPPEGSAPAGASPCPPSIAKEAPCRPTDRSCSTAAPKARRSAGNFSWSKPVPEAPELADGQVLVRNQFLTLDPYMRGRMNDAKSYAAAAAARQGDAGRHRGRGGRRAPSHVRAGRQGRRHGRLAGVRVVDARTPGVLRKVDTSHVPLSAYLGAVGMPGVTAWYGLRQDHRIPRPARRWW